ncbi:hypothetical protein FNV43_RR16733 [Rhamnella rubrinervis]|uniref:Uncharacterized protein n=1 Tax=Rhamnella rubrinervis TaxID=2594499 RepID=A0A8K0GZE0_9ROSA|nr:hypothetical protein FNV43_RR16733 [Rhamnella rubrinervis]
MAGTSMAGSGVVESDACVDQLLAQMEGLVQSIRVLQLRNEAHERINKTMAVGDHSRKTMRSQRGKELNEDLDSTDKYIPVKGRTTEARYLRRMKHGHAFKEAHYRETARRERWWFGGVDETPFVDEITKVDTPTGFTHPKFILYDGIADPQDHIIHFKQAIIPTCIP